METRRTVRQTKMFNGSGSFRDDLDAGKHITGDPSGAKFICRVATAEMKVGWYIMLVDTILVVAEPPPDEEPPPVIPPPDSGYNAIESWVVYEITENGAQVRYKQRFEPVGPPELVV